METESCDRKDTEDIDTGHESCDRKDTEDIDTGHESCDRKDTEDIDTGHEAHNKSRLTSEGLRRDYTIVNQMETKSCDRKDTEDIDTGHEAHNKSRLTSEGLRRDYTIVNQMETKSCDRKDTEDIDTGHEAHNKSRLTSEGIRRDYTIVNQMETKSCDRKDTEDIDTGHEAYNKSRLTSEKYKKDKRVILGIIELKIVLSGKTGVGKSFLGNHLLTKQLFDSGVDFGSITSECSSGSRTLHDGTIIRVFDTPGFFDIRYERAELVKHMFSLSSLTAPGPHVFLYVLRVDERLTMENWDSIDLFRDIFGSEVNKYVIFVLNRKPKGTDAEKLIDRCKILKTILKECHDRYVTINFADSDIGVGKCVDNLLQMIRDTVRGNDQKHYSSDVFVDAERSYNEKQEFKKKQEGMESKLADKDKQINELKQQLFDQKKAGTGSIKKECGPMRERDYDKVRKFFQVILTNVTNPLDLCIALFSSGVFNADDTYEIEKIENRTKQCYKLLMKVLNDCGPNTFPKFLDALTSTGHQHTRDLLDAEEGELTVYFY
ncbi:hypothetical protein SNE40_003926 [Patella caerulea]|uniref:Uncharacterized protein n=1 Tax=Patella caerulea TaxID=87958 RepID=A0AAN8KF49_PATCE